MWKGEWKAWVALVGWPLIAPVFLAVTVCVLAPRHNGPAWTSGSLNEVRVLDADLARQLVDAVHFGWRAASRR